MFIIEEEPTRLLVKCAFCAGKGKDPFGIMSPLAACYVCAGKKAVWIEKIGTVRDCLRCKGSGVSPTGARNHCAACCGTGVICLEEPSQTCSNCNGTGWQPRMALYCIVCRGKGAIPSQSQSQREE